MTDTFDLPDSLEGLSARELTTLYLRLRSAYRALLKRAQRISRGSGGRLVESNRLVFASMLFTRVVVMAMSIDRLLPDCRPKEHWDFSSVASLVRNLSEQHLWLFWLCLDEVPEAIREGRIILTYLHDHGSRSRLFPEDTPTETDEVLNDLIRKFDANPFLSTFDEKARREAIKGHKTPFIQDDVLDPMGVEKSTFRFHYRFYSQHTHSGPVAFLRLSDHDRGKGVETEQEKAYMIVALNFACAVLHDVIEGYLLLFPDAEVRSPFITNREVVRNVERNQGRGRKRTRAR